MVKVGDKVHMPLTALYTDGNPIKSWGTVAWIHPAGRYYLAEFAVGGGTVRECFPLSAGGR